MAALKVPVSRAVKAVARKAREDRKLAAGGAIVGALAMAPEEAEAAPFGTLARQMGKRTREAWHGSPHAYDQVDLSHMGSGEGAQRYGAGYYAADRRGVAEDYRRQLSRVQRFDGQPYDIRNPNHVAAYWVDHFYGDRERALRYLDEGNAALRDLGQEVDTGPADVLRSGARLPDVTTPSGALYRLEIPDEDLLDWDAPLSEQPDNIRSAVMRAAKKAKSEAANPDDIDVAGLGNMTGGQAYEHLRRVYGNGASQELSGFGIPGIRYLDGVSRNAGEGTRNYVIFDDRNVNVVERNGQPVAAMPRGRDVALGAGVAALSATASAEGSDMARPGPTRARAALDIPEAGNGSSLEEFRPAPPEIQAAMASSRASLYGGGDRIEALPDSGAMGALAEIGDYLAENRPSEMDTFQRVLQATGLGQGLAEWARTTGRGDRTDWMQNLSAGMDALDTVAPIGAGARRLGRAALDSELSQNVSRNFMDAMNEGPRPAFARQTGAVGNLDMSRLRSGRTATPSEVPAALSGMRGGRSAGSYLTPEEAAKMSRADSAEGMLRYRGAMPSASELATAAQAGQAKRGWYQDSAAALSDVFEDDARRFSMLLAATSPQTSVESNLLNTVNIWSDWLRSQRPEDAESILQIMGRQVQGNKGVDSVLGAWRNNSFTSLGIPDEELPYAILSGPKVDSFARNLAFPYRGNLTDPIEVTNDTWQGRLLGVPQTTFSGSPNKAATDPGKGPGYLAANSLTRQAAEILRDRTGMDWTPAEVQESAWSFAKAARENAMANSMDPAEFIQQGRLTDSMIYDTPDFATLLSDPELPYRAPLERAGYAFGRVRPASARPEGNTVSDILTMGGARRQELMRAARRLGRDPNP